MSNLSFRFKKVNEKGVKVIIGRNISKNINQYIHFLHPDKLLIVADATVSRIYGEKIKQSVSKHYSVRLIVHPEGEKNKNLHCLEKVINEFFKNGGSPASCICSLGGGITGNVAGLAASVIYRGVKLVHIPTTLLAQLDSAPDVKQSINSSSIKNAIGTYKAPDLVIIDPTFLKSLNKREIRSGLAEATKHAFAQDLTFLDLIKTSNYSDLDVIEQIIIRTIELKIKHWENTTSMWNDKRKIERLTHLGHTVGKILEMIDIEYLTHGEAISHGMIVESYTSYLLGYLRMDDFLFIKRFLFEIGLIRPLSDKFTTKSIISKLYPIGLPDEPIFALLKELGNPDTISTSISKKVMSKALNWYLKNL